MPPVFEPDANQPCDPSALIGGCLERGADGLLLARDVLPPAFFDLRTGLAGELVQKLVNYRIRMAAVVPDLEAQPERFREFAREANARRELRFLATREDALAWLEGAPG